LAASFKATQINSILHYFAHFESSQDYGLWLSDNLMNNEEGMLVESEKEKPWKFDYSKVLCG